MKKASFVLISIMCSLLATAQDYRWQQRVEYDMDVKLDVKSHQFSGTQKLVYYNNSNDTLFKVYYHLYFNAFQPGSMMDVRSRTIVDPDRRIGDRISKLSPSEIGRQNILSLKQDGKATSYTVDGTILEVTLAKPILPKSKTAFDMKFEGQVPIQIRRSGRDSKEGIAYSMTQWYPKLAEYDHQGWHAYQYVAREFHGVWGDFNVKITLDPTFVVAGTGKLQNPESIGYGYEKAGTKVNRPSGDLTWNFVAKNVIDFAWAADPEYTHDKAQVPNGPELHFFYQKNEKTAETWKKLQDYGVGVFQFLNTTFGKYPFDTYSIIQGGDGGMEYPMCTLILGEGSLAGVAGTMAHEVAHSWFQMTLASNEALYAWMDEGFTDFAGDEAMATLLGQPIDHATAYKGYLKLAKNQTLEVSNQHSDHFSTNAAYRTGSYYAGTIFLHQLKYLIGEEKFYTGMRRYYNTWKMKHPEPNDFLRVMEKTSGLQLHWYERYWIGTTKKIDYAIDSIYQLSQDVVIELKRIGEFPMPIDLVVTKKDGTKELHYIPMNELMGKKAMEGNMPRTDYPTWNWVNPSYTLKIKGSLTDFASFEIDPSQRMADVDRDNNKVSLSSK